MEFQQGCYFSPHILEDFMSFKDTRLKQSVKAIHGTHLQEQYVLPSVHASACPELCPMLAYGSQIRKKVGCHNSSSPSLTHLPCCKQMQNCTLHILYIKLILINYSFILSQDSLQKRKALKVSSHTEVRLIHFVTPEE